MKPVPAILVLLLVLSFCPVSYGQNAKLTTIHIYAETSNGLRLFPNNKLNSPEPIKFGGFVSHGYTVIETDTSVLQLQFGRNNARDISIPFDMGRSYYYQITGSKEVPATIKQLTEQEFLLLICFEAYSYRRYSITKAGGLKLLEED